MSRELKIMLLFALAVVLAVLWAAAISNGPRVIGTAADCLRAGYPDYRIIVDEGELIEYCIRIEGGTQIVVPLKEVHDD